MRFRKSSSHLVALPPQDLRYLLEQEEKQLQEKREVLDK